MKKMNNKGFSLVELIVVIAIMAVLVGVLAPQFIKYVESSRRSTDISNAQNIQSAVLADIADGLISSSATGKTCDGTDRPSTMAESPKVKGNGNGAVQGSYFKYNYNAVSGTCQVFLNDGTTELTSGPVAESYKNNR